MVNFKTNADLFVLTAGHKNCLTVKQYPITRIHMKDLNFRR